MIMHLSMVIPGVGVGGGGSILPGDLCGYGPLFLLTFAANFQPRMGDWIAFAINFYSRIPGERPPGFVMYLAVNGWERE